MIAPILYWVIPVLAVNGSVFVKNKWGRRLCLGVLILWFTHSLLNALLCGNCLLAVLAIGVCTYWAILNRMHPRNKY